MKKINFTIGADPELFLKSPEGKFISSVGKIGGSKKYPRPIGNGCAIQEDNVAVEFNIPPSKGMKEFITGLKYNLDYLAKHAQGLGLQLEIVPSAIFTDDELNSPEAKEFGCEPDFNAWTRSKNPRPVAENKNLRSAGGHIHIGFNKEELDFEQIVRAMDIFVGCESLAFDKDKLRRELYGKAGAFRLKDYGVEYRTASNVWIQSENLMKWVYKQTEKALNFVKSGKVIPDEGIGQIIQNCINNSDISLLPEVRKFVNA